MFSILEAIRVKYRLSEDGYRRYYINTLRIKLSRFLYDAGTRKINNTIKQKQIVQQQQQQHKKREAATTTELFQESDLPITTTRNCHSYFDEE